MPGLSSSSSSLVPQLTDGLVTLRELRDDDVDTIVAYCNDPAMERWTTVPWPYRREHAVEYVVAGRRSWAEGSRFDFGIEYEGRLVGAVDLRRPVLPALAEIGFALAPQARGRGLMARALRLVLPWGARQGIEVVQWRANAGNWASRRAAWSVGFTVQGTLPGLLEHRGTIVDGWLASMRLTPGAPLLPAHPWFDPVTVTGHAVRLRAARDSDVPRFVQGLSDPECRWWLPGMRDKAFTDEEARAQLRRNRENEATGKSLSWVVTDADRDVMLGEVVVFIHSQRDGQGEVGYWMHPEGRGRGLATEAAFLAARHALLPLDEGGLGWANVGLRASVDNVASRRVAEKAGFRPAGTERGIRRPPDDSPRVDLARYDMIPGDLAGLDIPGRR
ncbi:GNAT family N-acetyltransferase [Kineosporia sp. J2-2]|uniref:GNAT family N-acetyltransferase n=1 Tax=Kineosporia corallincola TaxID=2835133 RepID=A0ABS5TGU1_9ACTN|nr:GNAT family N-acetyltransferase [Kineosporia corallincola]MBT0770310.1 GNAT family N-acetyltransferase [Kineosporia corallincola]